MNILDLKDQKVKSLENIHMSQAFPSTLQLMSQNQQLQGELEFIRVGNASILVRKEVNERIIKELHKSEENFQELQNKLDDAIAQITSYEERMDED